jgi:viroplasmin and RNaseH domain-containing protein
MKWYTVFKGHCPGVYDSWPECAEQISGFEGNVYKGYKSRAEAETAFHKFMQYEQSAAMYKNAVHEAIEHREEQTRKKAVEQRMGSNILVKDVLIGFLVAVVLIQFVIIFK